MKATLSTGEIITGKTVKDIVSALNKMLRVSGPRGLIACTDTGTEIVVSLYDGESYVKTAAGRVIYRS